MFTTAWSRLAGGAVRTAASGLIRLHQPSGETVMLLRDLIEPPRGSVGGIATVGVTGIPQYGHRILRFG